MKIAFVVDAFPKLSESFVVSQITGLVDMGHDVHIFANVNPHEPEISNEVLQYGLDKKVVYVKADGSNKTIRRLKAAFSILANFFIAPGAVLRVIRRLLSMSEGFSYRLLYYAISFIGKEFDIVHCHFGPAGNIGVFLRSVGFDFKLVTTLHGFDVTTYIEQHGKEVYRELFDKGDVFTYNSEATRSKLFTLDCPVDRMVKLPMGIDIKHIEFSARCLGNDGRAEILSVGRLVDMKGREFAIRAVAMVADKFPNLRYNIVGDGPLRQSLQTLIDELGVGHIVKLLGWVSSSELEALYRSAHIFMHPSVKADNGNMEGQGVVLLEAQARGIPVLATDHSAFPETVVNGKSGFLVPERDVDALAERLDFLLANPAQWLKIGTAGRKHAEKYDIDVLNKALEKIYISL